MGAYVGYLNANRSAGVNKGQMISEQIGEIAISATIVLAVERMVFSLSRYWVSGKRSFSASDRYVRDE
jgi:hypothetical protein